MSRLNIGRCDGSSKGVHNLPKLQPVSFQNIIKRSSHILVSQAVTKTTSQRTETAAEAIMCTEPSSNKAVPSTAPDLVFRQLFDASSSTYTYLLADPVSKEALLLDPVLEQVERDLQIIDELGLHLTQTANTHCHADHITGSGKIKALRPGVTSAIAATSSAKADVLLSPGDVIKVGQGLALTCLATPGHTNGCMSFYLPPGVGRSGMVFTGDALLIRGCGRTDFQEGDPGLLYDSVHSQLFSLPDSTLVYPAHDYKGRTASSIGEEKAHNLRLTKGREEFINIMNTLGLPPPKQLDKAVPANLNCGVDFPYD